MPPNLNEPHYDAPLPGDKGYATLDEVANGRSYGAPVHSDAAMRIVVETLHEAAKDYFAGLATEPQSTPGGSTFQVTDEFDLVYWVTITRV